MKKIMLVLLAVASAGISLAQNPSQHVLSPRLLQRVSHNHLQASRVAAADTLTVFVTLDGEDGTWETLREAGFRVIPLTSRRGTLRVASADLLRLSGIGGIKYVESSDLPRPMVDEARRETQADRLLSGDGPGQPFTGKGVVVGIVDAGFDYLHSAFRNPDDGTLRIRRVWEQGSANFEDCKAPEKFGYGLELTTPEMIVKAKADRESNSHGTHVAALAAGSDAWDEGIYQGVAPDADIVLVALDLEHSTNADIANGVAYIFDYAESVGKPCVVNLSLGNHDGPHDGTSTFDVLTDEMQGEGRLIVGAAGNHRADKFHIERAFQSADDQPLRTFIHYNTTPSTVSKGGSIEVWGDVGSHFEVALSAYSIFNHEDAETVTVEAGEGVQEVSLGRYVTGSLTVTSEISPLNGRQHLLITSGVTNIRMNYAIAITVTPKAAGTVNIWADNAWLGLESRDIEGFSGPEDESTVAEIGGTGRRILTVGAYTTRNDYTTLSGSGTLDETLGDVCSFSSCGPTLDGRPKPEVCAPGCFIISGYSSFDTTSSAFIATTHEGYDGHTDQYGYMQGTSMAAPFTAGIVASWLDAYPRLSPEQLHSVMLETARKDDFTQNARLWGAGKVDAYAGLLRVLQLSDDSGIAASEVLPAMLSVSRDGLLTVVPSADGEVSIKVCDAAGRSCLPPVRRQMQGGRMQQVSLGRLPSGVYLISVSQGTRSMQKKVLL